MKKIYLAFLIIFLLAFGLRLYRVTEPVADWHSWRQADTAAVARNFLRFGIDPLHPRYDDLSNIQSGKDNPLGYRMVEFPIYQTIAATLAKTFPMFSIELWLRFSTITISSLTAVLLGLIVASFSGNLAGVFAAFIFAVLPYNVYYGRSILPDPWMVWWAVLSLWLLNKKDIGWTIGAGIAGAFALLSKPMAIFLLAPAPIILCKQHGLSLKVFVRFILFAIISVVPILWWRNWILQFPEGIPVSSWLFNGNGIRFKGAWFHWLFAERLGNLMLGYWGLILFGFGVLAKGKKFSEWFYASWMAGVLAYFVVFATGNVQHDYYQILTVPVVSALVGLGLAHLVHTKRIAAWGLALVSFLAMIGFSWFTIRTYYWINHPEIVEAGKAADALLPPNAKVIASYNGDTTFLYQTGRQGWPLGFEIEKKIEMGATHYVTISPSDGDGETKDLASRYTVLVRNERYAIIDLTKPKK